MRDEYKHLQLVGIQGALHSGKTTVRDHLVADHGFTWVAMSAALKRGLVAMGAREDEVYGDKKMEPNELWGGKTNRFAMQTLGTEWGRKIMHPDIWVNCAKREIDRIYQTRISNPVRIVFDDIRFPNEYEMIKHFSGEVVTVRRPSVEYEVWKQDLLKRFGWRAGWFLRIHASERWWAIAPSDRSIYNIGSIMDDFMAEVERWVDQTDFFSGTSGTSL